MFKKISYLCIVHFKILKFMTQLTINIDNAAILPHLKKILSAIDGISIAKPTKKKKSGLEDAYDDVRNNRLKSYDSVDDFYKSMGI